MTIVSAMATALSPCKVELRLEVDEYAQALYLSLGKTPAVRRSLNMSGQRATVGEIREAIKEIIAEHGTRGVKKWYTKAAQDAEAMDSIQSDEGHWRTHLDDWLWCREQVQRAFKPRKPRTRKVEGALLIDVPLW